MSFKKRFASVIVAIMMVVTTLLATPSAQAQGNPNQLDKGDFTVQCRHQYGKQGWQAHLYGNTVDDWWCFYNNGLPWSVWTSERRPLIITDYCYRNWRLKGKWRNYHDPHSWYCG